MTTTAQTLAQSVPDQQQRADVLLRAAGDTMEAMEENFRMLAILLRDLLPLFQHATTEHDRVKMALTWLEGCDDMAKMALQDLRAAAGLLRGDA